MVKVSTSRDAGLHGCSGREGCRYYPVRKERHGSHSHVRKLLWMGLVLCRVGSSHVNLRVSSSAVVSEGGLLNENGPTMLRIG